MPMIQLNPNLVLPLIRCDGDRYFEGDVVPCGHGCQGHFDPNFEDEYSDVKDGYPNVTLAFPSLLRGSSGAPEVLACSSAHGMSLPRVAAYRNDEVFLDGDGQVAPAWIVTLNEGDPYSHFAAVFTDRSKAAGFVVSVTMGDE